MPETAPRKVTYDDLFSLPEHVTGEILDGELIMTPRPSAQHAHAASILGYELGPPFQLGRGGGPGGWVILDEVEIMLTEHLLVPDLAGWRKERFPGLPKENWVSVPPDWVCEILSPGSIRVDKTRKMPIYARHGIPYLWLIDPTARTLDAFRLDAGRWALLATFTDNDRARAEPFEAIEFELGSLWIT